MANGCAYSVPLIFLLLAYGGLAEARKHHVHRQQPGSRQGPPAPIMQPVLPQGAQQQQPTAAAPPGPQPVAPPPPQQPAQAQPPTTGVPGDQAAAAPPGAPSPSAAPPTSTPPPSGGDTYARLFAGAYKDWGQFDGQKFTNPDLQRMSLEMQAAKSCDGSTQGGDFHSTLPGVPAFIERWRQTVSCCPWDRTSEARARIAEAYFLALFREKWQQARVPPAASVEAHLSSLWYSNTNTKSKFAGGPGNIYCAAASSIMLCRGLQRSGFKTTQPKLGSYFNPKFTAGQGTLAKFAPMPGDVLSYVSAGGPRTGHVVTVVLAENQTANNYFQTGGAWVVSGNASPCGTVTVDYPHFDPIPSTFSPFRIDPATKKPYQKWQPDDKRPPAGKVWVYSNTRNSQVQPATLAKLQPDEITKLLILPCNGGPPGCPCSIPEAPPFNGAAAPPSAPAGLPPAAGAPHAAAPH